MHFAGRYPLRVCAVLLAGLLALSGRAAEPGISLTLDPREATIGDQLSLGIAVEADASYELSLEPIGPELGNFSVISGGWAAEETTAAGKRWNWQGQIAAYETGTLELPPIQLRLSRGGEAVALSTEAVSVELTSVLDAADAEADSAEIADLKAPASIRPDFRPMWIALSILLGLIFLAAVVWWLHRRYAARFAAVPQAQDLFSRVPPHVWVYEALQELIDRRLPEQGQVDLFYEELARILKRYLGGRFRIDLMESTTSEIHGLLSQTGIESNPAREAETLLINCDQVKFAKSRPDAPSCKQAVEQVYRIVDTTRPADAGGEQPAQLQAAH